MPSSPSISAEVYPLADQLEALPLYLSQYIEAHKSEYYASLKAAQQQLD